MKRLVLLCLLFCAQSAFAQKHTVTTIYTKAKLTGTAADTSAAIKVYDNTCKLTLMVKNVESFTTDSSRATIYIDVSNDTTTTPVWMIFDSITAVNAGQGQSVGKNKAVIYSTVGWWPWFRIRAVGLSGNDTSGLTIYAIDEFCPR